MGLFVIANSIWVDLGCCRLCRVKPTSRWSIIVNKLRCCWRSHRVMRRLLNCLCSKVSVCAVLWQLNKLHWSNCCVFFQNHVHFYIGSSLLVIVNTQLEAIVTGTWWHLLFSLCHLLCLDGDSNDDKYTDVFNTCKVNGLSCQILFPYPYPIIITWHLARDSETWYHCFLWACQYTMRWHTKISPFTESTLFLLYFVSNFSRNNYDELFIILKMNYNEYLCYRCAFWALRPMLIFHFL